MLWQHFMGTEPRTLSQGGLRSLLPETGADGPLSLCCQELSLIYGVPTTTSIPSLWTPQKAPGALAMLLKSQEMKYVPQFPLVCKCKLNVMQGYIHRFGKLINCVFRK